MAITTWSIDCTFDEAMPYKEKKMSKFVLIPQQFLLCYLSNFVDSMNLMTDFPHFFEFSKLKNAAFRRYIPLESNFY